MLRFCNLILDKKVNPRLTQSLLVELSVDMPLLAKLVWFVGDVPHAHPAVEQLTVKHVLICQFTCTKALHARHADAADLCGTDRYVAHKGERVALGHLRQFEADHRGGIIFAKEHVEPSGISSPSGNKLTIQRNTSLINSSRTVLAIDRVINSDYQFETPAQLQV